MMMKIATMAILNGGGVEGNTDDGGDGDDRELTQKSSIEANERKNVDEY